MRRIALTLHAHLPFYPPDLDEPNPAAGVPSFGSHWLLENTVECYLPLLRNLKQLEGRSGNKLNVSFSPVLLEQLRCARTKASIAAGLEDLVDRAGSDARRLRGPMQRQAQVYRTAYGELLDFYSSIEGDMVGEFSRLSNIELMTTALTHVFLPLLKYHRSACVFQIVEGARQAEKLFGRRLRGFWFPEMGYTPFVREAVSDCFDYFLVSPYGVRKWEGNAYRNSLGAGVGVVDLAVTGEIWHPMRRQGAASFARSGVYREFFKWDDTSRLKYWSITGPDVSLGEKELYSSALAEQQIGKDVPECLELLGRLRSDRLLATDAEFFGHHWAEGSDFLHRLLSVSEEYGVRFVPNSELILDGNGEIAEIEPRESCWGSPTIWMGPGRVAEVRADILMRTEKAISLFSIYQQDGEYYRSMLLKRLLRELIFIQASDYAFAIYTGRVSEHYDKVMAHHRTSFEAIAKEVSRQCSYCQRREFLPTLRRIARVNPLFPDLDCKEFHPD